MITREGLGCPKDDRQVAVRQSGVTRQRDCGLPKVRRHGKRVVRQVQVPVQQGVDAATHRYAEPGTEALRLVKALVGPYREAYKRNVWILQVLDQCLRLLERAPQRAADRASAREKVVVTSHLR